MTNLRVRTAVSPLRRRFDIPAALPCVDDLVAVERPVVPMHCLRPAAIRAAADEFVQAFPGHVLYAVKCNPEPSVLRAIHAGGVTHFDCASVAEVALVRQMFPAASIGAPTGFLFFGPTCDSADVMRGSFHLPADIAEGDWIEIGQLGAYVACLRTAFNGFDRARRVEVCDAPLPHAADMPVRMAA